MLKKFIDDMDDIRFAEGFSKGMTVGSAFGILITAIVIFGMIAI